MDNKDYLKQVVTELSKELPYKWKVQSFNRDKTKAMCVAFIDARLAVKRLNEVCVYGWHRKHFAIGDDTYCDLGVVMPDGTIQWRGDVGESENKTERAKTSASDSLKRAALNFGLGLFLYEKDIVMVDAKTEGQYTNPVKPDGTKIWDMTKYINEELGKSAKPQVSKVITSTAKPTPTKQEQPKEDADVTKRKEAALKAFNALKKEAEIIGHLVKVEKMKYTSVADFVKGESIDKVLEVYNKVK